MIFVCLGDCSQKKERAGQDGGGHPYLMRRRRFLWRSRALPRAGRPRQFLAAILRAGAPGVPSLALRAPNQAQLPVGTALALVFPEETIPCSTISSAFMSRRCCCTANVSAFWPPTSPLRIRRAIRRGTSILAPCCRK